METYKGKCKACGAENEVEVSDALQGEFREMAIRGITEGVMCDACYQAESARRDAAENFERRRQIAIHAGLPMEYTDFDEAKAAPGQKEFSRRVYMAGVKEGKSLFIFGRNRAGKTRAVARSAWHMIETGKAIRGDVRYFQAVALRKAITAAAKSDDTWIERDFYAGIKSARLLIIDDLDKGQWTPAGLEGLFRIIDDRTGSDRRKTWITSNADAGALISRLVGANEDCRPSAVAIVARLREMCVDILVEVGK
jgi:DNA replication protein DnaC